MDFDEPTYASGSLNVAAFLLSRGYRLARVDPTNGSYATFVFLDPGGSAHQLATRFREDEDLHAFLKSRSVALALARRVESSGEPLGPAAIDAEMTRIGGRIG